MLPLPPTPLLRALLQRSAPPTLAPPRSATDAIPSRPSSPSLPHGYGHHPRPYCALPHPPLVPQRPRQRRSHACGGCRVALATQKSPAPVEGAWECWMSEVSGYNGTRARFRFVLSLCSCFWGGSPGLQSAGPVRSRSWRGYSVHTQTPPRAPS